MATARDRLKSKIDKKKAKNSHTETVSTSNAEIRAQMLAFQKVLAGTGAKAGAGAATQPKRETPSTVAPSNAGAGAATAMPTRTGASANLEEAKTNLISAALPQDHDFMVLFFKFIAVPEANLGKTKSFLTTKLGDREYLRQPCSDFIELIFANNISQEQRTKYIQDNQNPILQAINKKLKRPAGRDQEMKGFIQHVRFDFKDFPGPRLAETNPDLFNALNTIKTNTLNLPKVLNETYTNAELNAALEAIKNLLPMVYKLLSDIDQQKYTDETVNLYRIVLDLQIFKDYYLQRKMDMAQEIKEQLALNKTAVDSRQFYLDEASTILDQIRKLKPEEMSTRWFKCEEAFIASGKQEMVTPSGSRKASALATPIALATEIMQSHGEALFEGNKIEGIKKFLQEQKRIKELLGYPPPTGIFIENDRAFSILWQMLTRKIKAVSNRDYTLMYVFNVESSIVVPGMMEFELNFLDTFSELLELLRVTLDSAKRQYFKNTGDLRLLYTLLQVTLEIYAKYRDSNQSAELYIAESAIDNLGKFATRYYGIIPDDTFFSSRLSNRLNVVFPEYKDVSLADTLDTRYRQLNEKICIADLELYVKYCNSVQRAELETAQKALVNLKEFIDNYDLSSMESFKKCLNDAFIEYTEKKISLADSINRRLELIKEKINRAEAKAARTATAAEAQRNRDEARIEEQKQRDEKKRDNELKKHLDKWEQEDKAKADKMAKQAEAAHQKFLSDRKKANDHKREPVKSNQQAAGAAPEAKRMKKPATPAAPLTEQEKMLEKANTCLGELRNNKVPDIIKKQRAAEELKNPDVLITDYFDVIKTAKQAIKLADDKFDALTIAKGYCALAECYIGQTVIHLRNLPKHRGTWNDAEYKTFEQEVPKLYEAAANAAKAAHECYINIVEPNKDHYAAQENHLNSVAISIETVLAYANNLAGGTKHNLVEENQSLQDEFDESIRRRNEALKRKAENEKASAVEFKEGEAEPGAAAVAISESKEADEPINDDLVEKEGLKFKHNRKAKSVFAKRREDIKKLLERNKRLINTLEACETLLLPMLNSFKYLTGSETMRLEAPREEKDGDTRSPAAPGFMDRLKQEKNRAYPGLGTATHFRSPPHADAGAGVTPEAERLYNNGP